MSAIYFFPLPPLKRKTFLAIWPMKRTPSCSLGWLKKLFFHFEVETTSKLDERAEPAATKAMSGTRSSQAELQSGRQSSRLIESHPKVVRTTADVDVNVIRPVLSEYDGSLAGGG